MARTRLIIIDEDGRTRVGLDGMFIQSVVIEPLPGSKFDMVAEVAYEAALSGVKSVKFRFNGVECEFTGAKS